MAPKKKTNKITSKSRKRYGCNEVEVYLDRAIHDVKQELLPRIELIDSARKAMADTSTIIDRQNFVEKQVSHLTTSVDKLHDKFDLHVQEETREWTTIKEQIDATAQHVAVVQKTIDTVSANGNQGLHSSLKDLYNGQLELRSDVKGLRESIDSFQRHIEPSLRWHEFGKAGKNLWKSSMLFRIFRTRVGTFIAISLPLLLIALGIMMIWPSAEVVSAIIGTMGVVLGLVKKVVSE